MFGSFDRTQTERTLSWRLFSEIAKCARGTLPYGLPLGRVHAGGSRRIFRICHFFLPSSIFFGIYRNDRVECQPWRGCHVGGSPPFPLQGIPCLCVNLAQRDAVRFAGWNQLIVRHGDLAAHARLTKAPIYRTHDRFARCRDRTRPAREYCLGLHF